jgi:hypothetical protein
MKTWLFTYNFILYSILPLPLATMNFDIWFQRAGITLSIFAATFTIIEKILKYFKKYKQTRK